MKENRSNAPRTGGKVPKNRFTVRTAREPYSDKAQYLKAMSQQLTPDIWETIVMRAIHDATFGRSQDRAKAREWFAKYILPYRIEIGLQKEEINTGYGFLADIYNVFRSKATSNEEIVHGLAVAFAALSPEERISLRTALVHAEGADAKQFWVDARTLRAEREAEGKTK